jgi:hypothetical protein
MSRLARILRARNEAEYAIALYATEAQDEQTSTHKARLEDPGLDGQRSGVRRSHEPEPTDRSQFKSRSLIETAKYLIRKVNQGFEAYADAGKSFSVEQKVQIDFQIGQSLLQICDFNEIVLQSIQPWARRTFGWVFWGRGSQIVGPRRVGKTFGSCAVKTVIASVCRNSKACFVNLYSESGGQIIEYIKDFHRILQNDPRRRLDTVFLKVHNKYHLQIQSLMQREALREMGIEPPDPNRLRATMTIRNTVGFYNQISSLPNRAQQAGAVRGIRNCVLIHGVSSFARPPVLLLLSRKFLLPFCTSLAPFCIPPRFTPLLSRCDLRPLFFWSLQMDSV